MNAALRLGLFLLTPLAALAQAAGPGQIRSYIVQGQVELVDESTGAVVPLRAGRIFSHGFSVRSSDGSRATFYLSNGSNIVLNANSSLTVARFEQAPFSPALGSFHSLSADPSRSAVQLNLNSGTLSGRVRRLQPSSTFDIQTPAGRVSVHGTTYNVSITTDANGNTVLQVTNLDGGVTFHPVGDGAATPVAQGTVVSVRVDQSGTAVIFDTRAVTPEQAQVILQAVLGSIEEDSPVASTPVFIPVEVDPSVVSPEGGSGE